MVLFCFYFQQFGLTFLHETLVTIRFLFLKSKFYYYSGMARPTDQRMTAVNKIVFLVTDPKRRGHPMPQGGVMCPGKVKRQRE